MDYNWQALIVFIAIFMPVSLVVGFLVFRVPVIQEMRAINREQDALKMQKESYRKAVKENMIVAVGFNMASFFLMMPFILTLEAQPIWRYLLDIAAILLIYDFYYYVVHRFLFHGKGYWRRVHGLHHKARKPTFQDATFVHPMETAVALAGFIVIFAIYGFAMGGVHVISAIVISFIFAVLNQVNHAHFDVPKFPWKWLDYLTTKHAVHHRNMQSGNYASMILIYDKMFGTLES